MRMLFILLLIPCSFLAQDQDLAERNCQKWIKSKMQDDTSTYNHLLFTDLEEVISISAEGKKAIEEIDNEKYELFHSTLESGKIGDYKSSMDDLKAKSKATKKAHSSVTGYKFTHKFQAKDKDSFLVEYAVEYILDLEMNISETSIKRHVDRAGSDY